MNKPYQEISLLEFQTKYQTEEDCEKRLFKLRWPQGFACPICGCQEYYHVTKRKLYQCKKCKHQTFLTAGTVMHNTRTSLLLWFWAKMFRMNVFCSKAFFVSFKKKGGWQKNTSFLT